MNEYIYVLKLVPRLLIEANWTDEDNACVGRHFKKLQSELAEGRLILAGRTQVMDETTFGIVIFKASDALAANAFMQADPAVAEGIMTAECYPFKVALM